MRRLIFMTLIVGLTAFAGAPADAQDYKALLSPGPVSKTHENIESTCDRCHLVFKGIPDEKCLKCHKQIRKLETLKVGFHASVAGDACIKCHTDHKGRDGDQTRADAKKAFDHDLTRFPLGTAHSTVKCDYCHNKPLEKVNPKCASCHDNPHDPSLGTQCQDCHSAVKWKKGVKTLADHVVRMDGGHANKTCADCHGGGKHIEKQVACASCHDQAHGGTKAACNNCHSVSGWKPAKFDHSFCDCKFPGKHREANCLGCHKEFNFTNTPNLCSGCHAKELTHSPVGECSKCHSPFSWKKNTFDHNKRSKFKLVDLHLTVDCARCHPVKRGKMKFRGQPKVCEGCHLEDGETAHGDFGACAKCHTTKGFDQPTFDHASTGFPIDGKHSDLGCQDCHAKKVKGYPGPVKASLHEPESGRARIELASLGYEALAAALSTVGGTKASDQACAHCHDNPHPEKEVGDCAGCHQTKDWAPSTFTLERHNAGTVGGRALFKLEGAHTKTECQQCHAGLQLRGLPSECAGCHVDVHQGKFGQKCTDCHSMDAFSPVPNFDHKITGFALTGNHEKAECNKCHGGLVKTDKGPVKMEDLTARKNSKECVTCHGLGHGKELGMDCEKCHATTDKSFAAAKDKNVFDHKKTGFPLERRHRMLACKSCHPVNGIKPVDRCDSCHMSPHSGQLSKNCATCHRPDRWRLARYDHDQTGFPLRGRHQVTACATCHQNQRWIGLTRDCFDCHALDAARALARVPGPHRFGRTDCRDCHFNGWRWRM